MASSLSREIKGDKNRLFAVQSRSKIPVRRANPLNNDSEKRSSSKDEADKKQRILRDSVEKLQNKRPSRIPIVVGRTHSKTDKNVISATRKRPLGRGSGINLQEVRGKQEARIKTTANPQNVAKHSSPEHVTQSTPPLRRRTPRTHVTPLNTKQVSNDVKKSRDEDTKVQGESVQCRNGVCTSCKENLTKEIEQLKKENSEIVEELMQWVEDGDKENKTLEEIIEKNSDENVKLLVQISVMKKEMKALEKKNEALQTELEMKRDEVGALEKEVSHFKTDELEYKKLRHETSRLIDQLEIQLDTFMNESTRKISEKDKEMEELKEEKSSVIDELENQLAVLTKENAEIISEKNKNMTELEEKSRIVGKLKDELEMSMNESARITSEKNKEISELKEEKSRAFGQFMDRLDSLLDENAEIVAEKDKEINELKNQKSRAIDQLEGEKWSVIGQFNERIESIMNKNARAISEKDKELEDLQNKMSNMFDQFNDRFSMIMDENDRNNSEKDAVISELKVEKSRLICQLKNQLAKLKKENSSLKTELLKDSNKDKRLSELQEQIENLNEQKILTQFELGMFNNTYIKNEKLMSLKNPLAEMKRQTEKKETQTFLLNKTDSCSHAGSKN